MLYYENQLNLGNIYSDCSEMFKEQRPEFLELLNKYININSYIPYSFKKTFYADTGRPRGCSLYGYVSALILQKIFNIPSDTLLILILNLSSEVRSFCGIDNVPDNSKWTRFKQDFSDYLQEMFIALVDFTEPICQSIEPELANMLSYCILLFIMISFLLMPPLILMLLMIFFLKKILTVFPYLKRLLFLLIPELLLISLIVHLMKMVFLFVLSINLC